MNLLPPPPFAPYPPAAFRKELIPEEWEACLDAWLSLSQLYLSLGQQDFQNAAAKSSSLISFLKSYYHETSQDHHDGQGRKNKEHALKRTCFILTHRVLLNTAEPPPTLLQWDFLSRFSHVYTKTQSLENLFQSLWQRKGAQLEATIQDLSSSLLKPLESTKPDSAEQVLKRIAPFLYASWDAAKQLMTGSDLMDAMSAAYTRGSPGLRETLVTVCYLGLSGAMKGEKPNHSLIFDHLYSLKGQAERGSSPSLLADLVTNTPILSRLRTGITGRDADRAHHLATALSSFRTNSLLRPRRATASRKGTKGKGKAVLQASSGQTGGEQHIHRMSLITQIQDLFPELGSGFISRLLDEYDESVEEATAHLLDESLPPHLSGLDRSAELPTTNSAEAERDRIEHMAPRSTPPPPSVASLPIRKNKYDNDALDRLDNNAVSRLHKGRSASSKATADKLLADRSSAPQKSAILAALAAFDADDDERDDTYDEADVGGYVDTSRPAGEEKRDLHVSSSGAFAPSSTATAAGIADAGLGEAEEAILYRTYTSSPHVFSRDATTRRSAGRANLKRETGMTDEALEGWAAMVSRDARRFARLRDRFEGPFSGGGGGGSGQVEIARTAYREGDYDDEDGGDEDGEASGDGSRGRGQGRGRGRGGRGGGRGRGRGGGPNVSGAPGDKSTQIARQRKEARGGNRRDQRARKMARGGFPG